MYMNKYNSIINSSPLLSGYSCVETHPLQYAEVKFLKNKFVKVGGANTFPQPVTQRRGITSQKKNGIMRVLKGGPQGKVIFWSSLAVNEGKWWAW